MELRTKHEVRQIQKNEIMIRQKTAQVFSGNASMLFLAKDLSGIEGTKAGKSRTEARKNGTIVPEKILKGKLARKWQSYSVIKKLKIQEKAEAAVNYRAMYGSDFERSYKSEPDHTAISDDEQLYSRYEKMQAQEKTSIYENKRSTYKNRAYQYQTVSPENNRRKDVSRRISTDQKKQAKRYRSQLVAMVEADLRKDEWIQEQQVRSQMEVSTGELEWKTGTSAVKTAVLPVRAEIAVLLSKGASRLMQTGMVILKHAVIAMIPIITALLFLVFASSLISGIAGEEEQQGYASSGYEIVAYAQEWIGVTRYIWGAGRDSPTSWQEYADCSAFVHGVFAHFGYEIGYDTYAMEQAGTLVSGGLENAMPGDIILFYSGSISAGMSSHVGIYAGDGKMIHCSGGRSNISPETAGQGVCWGSPVSDGRPFQIRRILTWTESEAGNATAGHRKDTTAYSQGQMELIWAIVAQEDNGSYAGALAVISSAMNRTESANWKYCGSNSLAQLTAPGQYCYSNDDYWRARLNGNVPAYVKQAVNDCLEKGIRNHSFTSFRSTKGSVTGPNAVQIGGNWYFGS